jgi:hypothetical protein
MPQKDEICVYGFLLKHRTWDLDSGPENMDPLYQKVPGSSTLVLSKKLFFGNDNFTCSS